MDRQIPLDFRPKPRADVIEFSWEGEFEAIADEFDHELEQALDRGYRVPETVERFGKQLASVLDRQLGSEHELTKSLRQAATSRDQGKLFDAIAAVRLVFFQRKAA